MPKICVIPGDGIGAEVIDSAVSVLESMRLDLEFRRTEVGIPSFEKHGTYLTEEAMKLATESDAILFGAITTPKTKREYVSPLLMLRWNLELYANVRPARAINPEFCLVPLDVVIVRENSEGLYGAAEREADGKIVTERIVSEMACERIIEFAFQYAVAKARAKVTCVHKANVLKTSDETFKKLFYGRAVNYAFYNKIKSDDCLVDAAAMYLCKEPKRFDVLVTLNLYGDILSDEAAGLVGGLGFAPSANIGKEHAMFEPVHGSAPDIAKKDLANPTGAILSAAMMLDYLNMPEKAALIRDSIDAVYKDKNKWTKDVGGNCGTEEFTWHVINEVKQRAGII